MTVSTLEDGMLGRTLGSAALAIAICFSVQAPAQAQNLEAGKSPAQIFNGACMVCHKSPRGLVKSVPPGSLPGFLRQHYTTSSDMARALSGYLLANGAVDRRPSVDRSRRGREAAPAVTAPAAPAQNGWWPFRSQPPVQGAGADGSGEAGQHSGRKSNKHRKKSKAAKSKSHQENAPSHNAAGSENAKPEDASSHAPKAEQESSAPTQRPGPVPAVAPAAEPKASESKPSEPRATEPKSSEPSSATPHASESKPAEPKSSESKPPDSKTD
ncbi:MAG: hypothetical protein WBA48_10235 [Xanthobacteraceae bacterium]